VTDTHARGGPELVMQASITNVGWMAQVQHQSDTIRRQKLQDTINLGSTQRTDSLLFVSEDLSIAIRTIVEGYAVRGDRKRMSTGKYAQ
jgi:hypothetical protein